MTALVFQNAACAWRCWYCFVPEDLLKADPNRSAWFTAAELVELYRQIPDAPRIIDLSGGSPDLVPGMDALDDAGADASGPRQIRPISGLTTISAQPTFSKRSRPPIWLSCELPQLWPGLLHQGLRRPLLRVQHARGARTTMTGNSRFCGACWRSGSMSMAM